MLIRDKYKCVNSISEALYLTTKNKLYVQVYPYKKYILSKFNNNDSVLNTNTNSYNIFVRLLNGRRYYKKIKSENLY